MELDSDSVERHPVSDRRPMKYLQVDGGVSHGMDAHEEAKVRYILTYVGLGAVLTGLTAVVSIMGGLAADPAARFDPVGLSAVALFGLVIFVFGGALMAAAHLLPARVIGA